MRSSSFMPSCRSSGARSPRASRRERSRAVDDLLRLGLNNAAWATGLAIVAAVGGMLRTKACKPAQRVKKGEVLFEIDSRAFALELQKAEAEVNRLQSRLKAIRGQ